MLKILVAVSSWAALLLGAVYLGLGFWWLGDRVSVAIGTSFVALGISIMAYGRARNTGSKSG